MITTLRGKVHDIALCLVCHEQWDLFSDETGYNDMKNHVNQTGHMVSREIGTAYHYEKEGANDGG